MLGNRIIGPDRFDKTEFILEPRTTAAIHRKAQNRGLALFLRNRRDARRSGGSQNDVGGEDSIHAQEIGARAGIGNRTRPITPDQSAAAGPPTATGMVWIERSCAASR